MNIEKVFKYARENKISDVHIIENEKIYFRKFGEILEDKNLFLISKDEILTCCENNIEKDFCYIDTEGNRYRISSFMTKGKVGLVARIINKKAALIENNFIDEIFKKKILTLKDGLILVTGATGSGKSTTLANIIEKFNENINCKILTLEDPIEYAFENKKALIIQREIGTDTTSYEVALKNSLRQDPDIVVVGEVRDEESLTTALKLAETGHLVLTTMHTRSAVEAVSRILTMVNTEKRDFIRSQLSSVLRFIFSQELYIDKKNEKVIPIFEILNNTKAVANLILSDKLNQISSLIESGIENSMITKEKYFKNLNIERKF